MLMRNIAYIKCQTVPYFNLVCKSLKLEIKCSLIFEALKATCKVYEPFLRKKELLSKLHKLGNWKSRKRLMQLGTAI